jgi:hypothetical protein
VSPSDTLRALLAVLKGEGGISGLGDVRELDGLPDSPFCVLDSGMATTDGVTRTVTVSSPNVAADSIIVLTVVNNVGVVVTVGAIDPGVGFTASNAFFSTDNPPVDFYYIVVG